MNKYLKLVFCLFALTPAKSFADDNIYVIIDMDMEVFIGGEKKAIGSEFSMNDTIIWRHANLRLKAQKKSELIKGNMTEGIVELSNIKDKGDYKPAFKYKYLGSRSIDDGNNLPNNIFRLKKGEKLIIPVRFNRIRNRAAEVMFKINDRIVMFPIRRTEDDKYYELTDAIFEGLPTNKVYVLTIHEFSLVDSNVSDNVYQDLIVVFVQ